MQEVVSREVRIEVRVVVLKVDAAADRAAGPEQASALAKDLCEVGLGNVLADIGARDEVDRLRLEAGRAGVAGSEIGDPETLIEFAERRDRAAQRTQVARQAAMTRWRSKDPKVKVPRSAVEMLLRVAEFWLSTKEDPRPLVSQAIRQAKAALGGSHE